MKMRSPSRVAVTSRSFSKNASLVSALGQRIAHPTLNEYGQSLSGQDLCDFLQGHDAAIVGLELVSRSLFERVPELKIISKYGVGLDSLDLDAFDAAGVCLGWTPGVNRHSVAELAVSAMISLLHRVPEATSDVIAGHWRQWRGRQLRGTTVGVVGCGNVGQEVVRILSRFDCRILVTDIREYSEFFSEFGVEPVELEVLIEEASVVTVHVPHDASTTGLINESLIMRMRPGAILINTARGGIVDEEAVLRQLETGALSGVAFDVLAQEPPQDRRLIEHPKTIITPHIGGSTEEAIQAMGMAAIDGLFNSQPVANWRAEGTLP